MSKRVAAYVRVSTTGQNIDGQKQEIEKWLNGHSTGDVRWYVDKASGTNLDRPAFEELQRDVFAGEVGTIVVYKMDRISRSLKDGINVLVDWIERGVRVVAVSQQLDFSGTTGKLIASVLFAVAEMENETRRERQSAGIEAAKKRGMYQGRQRGTTKANPRRAQELRQRGLSDSEIAKSLDCSRRTVQRYLSS